MSSENSFNFNGLSTTTSYTLDPFIINYDTIMSLMTGKAKIIYKPIFNSDGFIIKNNFDTIEYNFENDPSFDNLNPNEILSKLPKKPPKEFIEKAKNLINRYCKVSRFSIDKLLSNFACEYEINVLNNNVIIYYDSLEDKVSKIGGNIGTLEDIVEDKSFIISNNSKKWVETKLISPYIPVYEDFSNPEMYFNDSIIDQHIICELAKFCNFVY